MNWKRQQQNDIGNYWFRGPCYLSLEASLLLTRNDIRGITKTLRTIAIGSNGIGSLQAFVHTESHKKIWVIDQTMIPTSQPQKNSKFIILLPFECFQDSNYKTQLNNYGFLISTQNKRSGHLPTRVRY